MNLAQVIAAVATGALLTVATMLLFKARDVQRGAERERLIDAAACAVVEGVETFRQRPGPAEGPVPDAPRVRDDAVEIRSKAHLRMLVDKRAPGAPSRPPTVRERPHADRPGRRRPLPETRP